MLVSCCRITDSYDTIVTAPAAALLHKTLFKNGNTFLELSEPFVRETKTNFRFFS